MDIDRLIGLYQKASKHSGYQILPEEIMAIIGKRDIDTLSRYEKERLHYIEKNVSFHNKSIIDVGGNTGYFTFESIKRDAKCVDYYEGNKNHSEFVTLAKELFENKIINVYDQYFPFEIQDVKYDMAFCMNVIHHLGDDFQGASSLEEAKTQMVQCMNNMASVAEIMVFQIGYNWKGDVNQPLFANGTKREMIEFVISSTKGYWDVAAIGIAEKINGMISYCPLSENNIERDDALGEFLNRPLFILHSKRG